MLGLDHIGPIGVSMDRLPLHFLARFELLHEAAKRSIDRQRTRKEVRLTARLMPPETCETAVLVCHSTLIKTPCLRCR